jgi:hypothetical protein
MSLSFSLWLSPSGLYIDWVFHARNRELSPAQVDAEVRALRARRRARRQHCPAQDAPRLAYHRAFLEGLR